MIYIKKIRHRLRFWQRSEDGSATVEMVFMVPLLVWCLLATVTYFQAYRSETVATRAAETVADMISRESKGISPDYVDAAHALLETLSQSAETPRLRVTVIRWWEGGDKHFVQWSEGRGGVDPLESEDLVDIKDDLPDLANRERVVLLETWTDHSPAFDASLGLVDFEFGNTVIFWPRYHGSICMLVEVRGTEELYVC